MLLRKEPYIKKLYPFSHPWIPKEFSKDNNRCCCKIEPGVSSGNGQNSHPASILSLELGAEEVTLL